MEYIYFLECGELYCEIKGQNAYRVVDVSGGSVTLGGGVNYNMVQRLKADGKMSTQAAFEKAWAKGLKLLKLKG